LQIARKLMSLPPPPKAVWKKLIQKLEVCQRFSCSRSFCSAQPKPNVPSTIRLLCCTCGALRNSPCPCAQPPACYTSSYGIQVLWHSVFGLQCCSNQSIQHAHTHPVKLF
jgi:hypothetical protein